MSPLDVKSATADELTLKLEAADYPYLLLIQEQESTGGVMDGQDVPSADEDREADQGSGRQARWMYGVLTTVAVLAVLWVGWRRLRRKEGGEIRSV